MILRTSGSDEDSEKYGDISLRLGTLWNVLGIDEDQQTSLLIPRDNLTSDHQERIVWVTDEAQGGLLDTRIETVF